MKTREFEVIINESFETVRRLVETKGHEYSGDLDRLLNFKRNGAALGLMPSTIWAVYAAKHWDSIMQYMQDLQHGRYRELSEPIEGRIDDLITYLLLLKGLLNEPRANEKREEVK